MENYSVLKTIFGTNLEGYQSHAQDIQQRMQDVKQSTVPNKDKRQYLDSTKQEMNMLFRDAGKDLSREDLRQLRQSMKR